MATSVLGQVEQFELGSDDWVLYTERLDQFFLANEITNDTKKVAVLLTAIGPKAYSLLRNLLAPVNPATKEYEELIDVMKDHLRPKPVVIAERFKFHRRNQGDGETVAQYMVELRKLAEYCDFKDYLNEDLRDRFVCGLQSEATQRRLLTEAELNLKKAFETAQGMETASKQASELQASTKAQASPMIQHVSQQHPCSRCGRKGHSPDDCYFRQQTCRRCGKTGHIAKMCRNQATRSARDESGRQRTRGNYEGQRGPRTSGGYRAQYVEETEPNTPPLYTDADMEPIFTLGTADRPEPSIIVKPEVENIPLTMELDTGTSVSIISEDTWKTKLSSASLEKAKIRLRTYTGEQMKVLGQLQVNVQYHGLHHSLPLLVVEGRGPSLLGRNWLGKIKLDWASINHISSELDRLLEQYQEVFKEELGTLKGVQARLTLQPGAAPKFFRPRSVPYALREAIEKDLERLEQLGVIEKVNHSDWAAPIVPVPKADHSVQLCGDYKVTINPMLQVDQFPLPKPEDLFATLAGGEKFTKLDLSHAYQQVLLEPESRKYVTINTHKGLYQYNRLPFGVASAPAVFQQTMEKILHGIPRVIVYIDDILVTGEDNKEHMTNLTKVFDRLHSYGERLKKKKCFFMQPSVEYLGYLVDAEGLHATPQKVDAIVNAPRPKNTQELRSVLGLANYYGKFIRNLAEITHPLNTLLRKNTRWKWSQECEQSFQKLKQRLGSTEVLVHHDAKLPLKLECDASSYGVGAVISHVLPDGSERPIAYASRTMTQSEMNYSQIEKEALALIVGVKKIHEYLYGRQFTLVTDHKPLTVVLGSKRGLPTVAAARLQRWAIVLTAYQYNLEFRPTEAHGNADAFSRLPLPIREQEDNSSIDATNFNVSQIDVLPVDADQLRRATAVDPVLSKVVLYTQRGWPQHVDPSLQPYFHRRYELAVEMGCLLWGLRVVIPESCRQRVLEELHTSHPGIVKMKSLARTHV